MNWKRKLDTVIYKINNKKTKTKNKTKRQKDKKKHWTPI